MEESETNNSVGLEARTFRDMVEQSPVPVMITDRDANICFVNDMFLSLTGFSADEMLGKNPRVLSAGITPPKIYEDLWETVLAGKTWHGNLYNRRKSGEIFCEAIMISPLKNKEGETTHYFGIWRDVTRRKGLEENMRRTMKELETQSRTDDLTCLYNRRHILVELEREVERALRYGRDLAGLMVDVDNFKQVNDQYGHLVGDKVLRQISDLIIESVRKIDIVGRYGGDEFIVILPESTTETGRLVAERIRKNVAAHDFNLPGKTPALSVSIGLMSFSGIDVVDRVLFVEKIDQAMLRAKRAGKNCIAVEE